MANVQYQQQPQWEFHPHLSSNPTQAYVPPHQEHQYQEPPDDEHQNQAHGPWMNPQPVYDPAYQPNHIVQPQNWQQWQPTGEHHDTGGDDASRFYGTHVVENNEIQDEQSAVFAPRSQPEPNQRIDRWLNGVVELNRLLQDRYVQISETGSQPASERSSQYVGMDQASGLRTAPSRSTIAPTRSTYRANSERPSVQQYQPPMPSPAPVDPQGQYHPPQASTQPQSTSSQRTVRPNVHPQDFESHTVYQRTGQPLPVQLQLIQPQPIQPQPVQPHPVQPQQPVYPQQPPAQALPQQHFNASSIDPQPWYPQPPRPQPSDEAQHRANQSLDADRFLAEELQSFYYRNPMQYAGRGRHGYGGDRHQRRRSSSGASRDSQETERPQHRRRRSHRHSPERDLRRESTSRRKQRDSPNRAHERDRSPRGKHPDSPERGHRGDLTPRRGKGIRGEADDYYDKNQSFATNERDNSPHHRPRRKHHHRHRPKRRTPSPIDTESLVQQSTLPSGVCGFIKGLNDLALEKPYTHNDTPERLDIVRRTDHLMTNPFVRAFGGLPTSKSDLVAQEVFRVAQTLKGAHHKDIDWELQDDGERRKKMYKEKQRRSDSRRRRSEDRSSRR